MKYIDLHTHSNFSDGKVTLEHSLAAAEEHGLALFSVTDHNTVAAYSHMNACRNLFSGKILPGVELNTTFRGDVVEILGYGIDTEKMASLISEKYPSAYEKQVMESRLNAEAMVAASVVLAPEFVRAMTHEPWTLFDVSRESNRVYLLAEIKRHPENARFFESEEEFLTLDRHRFMRKYLFNAQSLLYSDQSPLCADLRTVLDMIRSCGGLTFLAHPFAYSENVISGLDEIADYGLDGMECFYGTFTPEQKQFMVNFCDSRGLFKSGGSDHHGLTMRPANRLGLSAGVRIPFTLIEPWLRRVENSLI